MDKDVFSTQEFGDYAAKNLVLVEVDFPMHKGQSAALKKANTELQKKYKIGGYPTLVLLNADGKKIGEEVGYGSGGPKAVLAKLDKYTGK